MFKNKTAWVRLEDFSKDEAKQFMNNLAQTSTFSSLTFGLNEECSKLFVYGPRETVNVLLSTIKIMSA